MSLNLIDMAKGALTDQIMEKAGAFLGEDVGGVTKGFGAAIPSILGSVVDSGKDAAGAGNLLGMIKQGGFDGSMLDNLGGIFDGGSATSGILDSGGGILKSLMGDKLGGVVDIISKVSGIGSGSSSKLMSLAAPMIMNMIGRVVKNKALDALGLSKLLGTQSSFIEKALPSGMGSLLGLGKVTDVLGAASNNVKSAVNTAASAPAEAVSGGMAKWLLPLALVLGGVFAWQAGCFSKATEAVTDATSAVVEKAGDVATDVKDMASNVVNEALEGIEFAAGSVGDQFSKFLASGEDAAGSFKFANLQFDSGSANIAGETGVEVDNLAAVLNAYPAVKIQVNGYTDSQGDDNMNQALSEQRANAVLSRLVAQGVAADRLSAVGHGEADPVGDNATAEGRAMNRRIEVTIVSK